jgi:hypothetical protein
VRTRLTYRTLRMLGKAPALESDSDYAMETRHLTALTRPPQGDFLCYASVSRGGKVLVPDKDVSGLLQHGSGYGMRGKRIRYLRSTQQSSPSTHPHPHAHTVCTVPADCA